MQKLPMWQQAWHYVFLTFIHPMFKWVLRKITGKCELQRIMGTTEQGARRTLRIEKSLKHSKYAALKRLLVDNDLNLDLEVQEIMKVKEISAEVDTQFGPHLRVCLCQVYSYRQLVQQLDIIRKEAYSSDNSHHEHLLMQLWTNLCPDVELESRINKQWSDIGFQGDDPMTDFRGMGMLGLHNLIFLVTKHTEVAKQLLSHSHHPQYGYSFAIVGINMTGLAYGLLAKGHLKTHFYNAVRGPPTLEHFHHLYCHLFTDFDQFYRDEKPKDIMQFNIVKNKYEKQLIQSLRGDKDARLKGKFLQ